MTSPNLSPFRLYLSLFRLSLFLIPKIIFPLSFLPSVFPFLPPFSPFLPPYHRKTHKKIKKRFLSRSFTLTLLLVNISSILLSTKYYQLLFAENWRKKFFENISRLRPAKKDQSNLSPSAGGLVRCFLLITCRAHSHPSASRALSSSGSWETHSNSLEK